MTLQKSHGSKVVNDVLQGMGRSTLMLDWSIIKIKKLAIRILFLGIYWN